MATTQGDMQLSVVMATYNRADTLVETLACLANQDLEAPCEVIIVDDGSTDETRTVVQTAARKFPYELKYLHHANQGPGYSQNRGIEIARAPVIVLMADDIFMAPGALRVHLDYHQRQAGQQFAALGKVLQSPLLDQSVFLKTWDPYKFNTFAYTGNVPYYFFFACNISFKREFMLTYGMFRDARGRAGPCCFEDLEVGYRLHGHGLKIEYEPGALGYHHHVVSFDQALQRKYETGLNYGEYLRLVPDPEEPVVRHVLNRRTWRSHWDVLRRDNTLAGAERRWRWHLAFHTIRLLFLNRPAVNGFWKPMLLAAEHKPWLARRVRPYMYRAVLYHYFLLGVDDGHIKFDLAASQTVADVEVQSD